MPELSKTYDPKTVEPKWYKRWIDNGDFKADADSERKPFSIVMPPPNITGVLTLGHVLNNSIQDILARRARMQGFEVLIAHYNKELIYRGLRTINCDPATQTALLDEEVINKPQRGNLYYVRYEIVDQPGKFLEVATTRPETIMADTGVAVHPKDKRYADLVGKEVWRPLPREKIPVVADEAIDPEFGTGVLKVTPAHDKVDFEVGQRHKLSVIDVLHPDGKINCPAVPELNGLDRFEARKRAAELLQERGLLSTTDPYENNVGFSDRSEVPIEPRLSEQWFLRYPNTKEALAVVKKHLIRFFPKNWEKVYAQWLANIQDWCISRQVWWGHRIPAWYCNGETRVQIDSPGEGWRQDEDTLDN